MTHYSQYCAWCLSAAVGQARPELKSVADVGSWQDQVIIGSNSGSTERRPIPLNDHAFFAAISLIKQKTPKSDFLFHHCDGRRAVSVRESFETLVKRGQAQRCHTIHAAAYIRRLERKGGYFDKDPPKAHGALDGRGYRAILARCQR